MPSFVKAAILGVVQGLTEFLPVSSTAHLLVGERLLDFQDPNSVFTEMIQLGSILAIMWLYRARIRDVLTGLPTDPAARRFVLVVVIAFVPAVLVGAFAADYVETVLHRSLSVMAAASIIGGIVMLLVERWHQQAGARARHTTRVDDVSPAQAAGIGAFQVLALIPGVSRSGATIVGGLLAGLNRSTAAEFSFFLAMPTMAATFAHSLLEAKDHLSSDRIADLAVGFVMAFIASAIVVKPFLNFVRRSGFAPFAWYRIAAGAAVFAAIWWST